MSSTIVVRSILACSAVWLLGAGLFCPNVQAGFGDHKLLDQTGCCYRCPACDHCCELEAELVDAKKECFKVESKVICIPRVVFPWQRKKCNACTSCDGRGCTNCVHNGARTRKVCVLTIDSYTCPECEYTWKPVKKGRCGPACGAGGCGAGCDVSCDRVWEGNIQSHPVPSTSAPRQVPAAPAPADQSRGSLVPADVHPAVSSAPYPPVRLPQRHTR